MEEWCLGWEKVSCLERCPQFRSVLIEREVPPYCTLYCVLYTQYVMYVHHYTVCDNYTPLCTIPVSPGSRIPAPRSSSSSQHTLTQSLKAQSAYSKQSTPPIQVGIKRSMHYSFMSCRTLYACVYLVYVCVCVHYSTMMVNVYVCMCVCCVYITQCTDLLTHCIFYNVHIYRRRQIMKKSTSTTDSHRNRQTQDRQTRGRDTLINQGSPDSPT